jgi:NAD(P)-dependent dehydrogenase (short-subunit alcohol dehydrogenase family)
MGQFLYLATKGYLPPSQSATWFDAHLDILILCAGRSTVTPFEELTPREWSEIVAVNLNGPFHVLRAARPILATGASVVAVASVAGQTGVPIMPTTRRQRRG